MTDDKTKGSEKSMLGKASALFHRSRDEGSEERLSLSSYWVGDIREERLVQIEAGATVAGNVVAPGVVASGLVYGSITTRELRIEGSGQIWGDVYTAALEMAPGGKLNGWVTALDEGTVDLLRSGEIGLGDLPGTTPPDLVTEDMNVHAAAEMFDPETSGHWLRIWRQLQAEAAVALIARAEIEATFEERLREAIEESPKPLKAVPKGASVGTQAETADREMGGPTSESQELPFEDEPKEAPTNSDAQLWQKASAMTAEAKLVVQRRLAAKQSEVDVLQRELAELQLQLANALEQVDRLKSPVATPPEYDSAMVRKVQIPESKPRAIELTDEQQGTSHAPLPGQGEGSTELDLCLEQLAAQGERLSRLAAELVEREIELSQARRLAEKRSQQVEQIKALAGKRIRQLDQEIRRLRHER